MSAGHPQRKHNNGKRHPPATKQLARKLRHGGLTHREISKKLGVATSTAHLWTVGISLTPEKKAAINKRRIPPKHHWSAAEKKKISTRLRAYQFKKKHTRESLIKEIKSFFKEHNRIPLKREFNSRRAFRQYFGTWNNAIRAAGFEPNPELYAKRIAALDGHICDSFAEQIIDNWLSIHNIPHQIHSRYKKTKMTADFFIPYNNTHIEYFGLSGANRRYDYHMKRKLAFIKIHRLKFIALYPEDLKEENLNQKLSDLIKKPFIQVE